MPKKHILRQQILLLPSSIGKLLPLIDMYSNNLKIVLLLYALKCVSKTIEQGGILKEK